MTSVVDGLTEAAFAPCRTLEGNAIRAPDGHLPAVSRFRVEPRGSDEGHLVVTIHTGEGLSRLAESVEVVEVGVDLLVANLECDHPDHHAVLVEDGAPHEGERFLHAGINLIVGEDGLEKGFRPIDEIRELRLLEVASKRLLPISMSSLSR
ncbi:MAG: hypothetical protein U0794_05445 [Isosphaeraceae bacterium]